MWSLVVRQPELLAFLLVFTQPSRLLVLRLPHRLCFGVAIIYPVIAIIRHKRRVIGKVRHQDATPGNFTPAFTWKPKRSRAAIAGRFGSYAARTFTVLLVFPPAVPFISIYVYRTGYVFGVLSKVAIGYPVIAIIQRKRRVIGKIRHLERQNQGCPYRQQDDEVWGHSVRR
jgi:hypothetical protein